MPASKMLHQEEEATTLDHFRLGSFPALHLFLDKTKHVTPDCSHLEESVEACQEVTAGDFSEGCVFFFFFFEGCVFRLRFRPMQVSHGEGYSGALVSKPE